MEPNTTLNTSIGSAGVRMLGDHISSEIASARDQIVRELKAELTHMKKEMSKMRQELSSQQLGLRNLGNDVRKSLDAATGGRAGKRAGARDSDYVVDSQTKHTGPYEYAAPGPAPEGYQQQGYSQQEYRQQQQQQAGVNRMFQDPDRSSAEALATQQDTQEMGFNDFVGVNAAKSGLPEAPTPADEPQEAPPTAQWAEVPQATSGSPNEQYFGLPKRLRKTHKTGASPGASAH
jgi:ribosomal protein L29